MKIDKIVTETKYMVEMSQSELVVIYELISKQVNSKSACTNTQFEIYNKLYPLFTKQLEEKSQSTIIGDYILENFPDEIVEGGVANTAIKLMEKLLLMPQKKTGLAPVEVKPSTENTGKRRSKFPPKHK